jgi:Holliday junction resolvasome RuvABC endonuclease subunit
MALEISGIVGLDLSLTSTGFARWGIKPDVPLYHDLIRTDTRSGSTRIERCLYIAQQIHTLSTKCDLFFIEDYAYGVRAKASSLATLGELGGIVKAVIMKHTHCEPFVVAPGAWKKFLCGKGNLDQASFKLEVFKKLGVEPLGHDDAAALAICDFARCLLQASKIRKLKKYEEEVIKKYRKEHTELRPRLQSLAKWQKNGG